jgi:hypothetical protein
LSDVAIAQPVCARPGADAAPLCGRTAALRWTSRRSEVTCAGCLREIENRSVERAHKAAVAAAVKSPIRCDYCNAIATLMIPGGGPSERSFACGVHVGRAGASLGAVPGRARTDEPLPGRDHFLTLGTDAMLAKWQAHREAFVPEAYSSTDP